MSPKDLSQTAYDHLWMHFTRMSSYENSPVPTIVRGEGTYIYDDVLIANLDPRLHDVGRWSEFLTRPYAIGAPDRLFRPLTSLSFAAHWFLHGDRPWVMHLVNVLLYGGVCAQVALLPRPAAGTRPAHRCGLGDPHDHEVLAAAARLERGGPGRDAGAPRPVAAHDHHGRVADRHTCLTTGRSGPCSLGLSVRHRGCDEQGRRSHAAPRVAHLTPGARHRPVGRGRSGPRTS